MNPLSILRALATACFLATLSFAADNTASGPVVPLPPFHVDEFSSYLGFAWKAVVKDDKITSVRFSRVDPRSLANRAGLLLDDELKAIDGHPVSGLTLEQLQQLFAREWKGESLTWQFSIERGSLFSKRHEVTLRLRTKPGAAEPTAKSEPVAEK